MIINSVLLDMELPKAFTFVTDRIDAWWPIERRHTGDRSSHIFLLASGRFFERAGDGREVELGKVTHWNEPHSIVLDFYIATGPDHPTEVEMRFEAEGQQTRLTVIHRARPESAHLWDERSPRYAASWSIVLAALARCVALGMERP
ncbi:MAG: SRPBCC domain-containing protein [Hyphomicrobiaceae bacterium]